MVKIATKTWTEGWADKLRKSRDGVVSHMWYPADGEQSHSNKEIECQSTVTLSKMNLSADSQEYPASKPECLLAGAGRQENIHTAK